MLKISDFEKTAMLELPDGERETLSRRLEALTAGFKALDSVDTAGVEPLVTVIDMQNVFREDVSAKYLRRDEIMANAPEQYDGYFQVPGTL